MTDTNESDFQEADYSAWNKMRKTVTEAGFREGAGAGRDAALQKGFDIGFSEGYKAAFELGYLKGFISTVSHHSRENIDSAAKSSLNSDLEETLQDKCTLCKMESGSYLTKEHEESDSGMKSISEIVSQQNQVMKNVLDEIQDDNARLLHKWTIKMNE